MKKKNPVVLVKMLIMMNKKHSRVLSLDSFSLYITLGLFDLILHYVKL